MKSLSSSRREVLVDCFHAHADHVRNLLPSGTGSQHPATALDNFRRHYHVTPEESVRITRNLAGISLL